MHRKLCFNFISDAWEFLFYRHGDVIAAIKEVAMKQIRKSEEPNKSEDAKKVFIKSQLYLQIPLAYLRKSHHASAANYQFVFFSRKNEDVWTFGSYNYPVSPAMSTAKYGHYALPEEVERHSVHQDSQVAPPRM